MVSTIAVFISSMVEADGLSAASIASTLSAISYQHKLRGVDDPTAHFVIKKIMAGLNKARKSDSRVPISTSMLSKLIQTADMIVPSPYERALVKAMYSLMFYGFLRIGEATDSKHNILFQNVSIDRETVTIKFTSFKHSAGKPCSLHIGATKSDSCPAALLSDYIKYRGTAHGYLFCFCDGRPVSPSCFRKYLTTSVSYARMTHLNIAPHSFRIGAATLAAMKNVPSSSIQAMGRWKSAAFNKYIRITSFDQAPVS